MAYVKDFTFDPAFGFTGSAQGRHDSRNHALVQSPSDDEYDDGTYVGRDQAMKRGGRAKAKGYQIGGPVAPAATPMAPGPAPAASPLGRATITMPVADASRAAAGLVQAGRGMGARQTAGNLAAVVGRRAALDAPAAMAPPPVARARVPGMKKGGPAAAGRRRFAEGGPNEESGEPGDSAPSRANPPLDQPNQVMLSNTERGWPGTQSGPAPDAPRARIVSRQGHPAPLPHTHDHVSAARQLTADDLNAMSLAAARAGRNYQPPGATLSTDDLNAMSLAAAREGRNYQPPGAAVSAAKGGFIRSAVKQPGRMQNAAKRAGVSTRQYMEEHKHDPDPSLRSAANLGLRLTKGDLSPHKKGQSR